jgi:hypothetical protein
MKITMLKLSLAVLFVNLAFADEGEVELLLSPRGKVGSFDVNWANGKPTELMWNWEAGSLTYELAEMDFFVAKPHCYKKEVKLLEASVTHYHCQLSPLTSATQIPDLDGSDQIEVTIEGTDETYTREVWNFATAWIRKNTLTNAKEEQLEVQSLELVLTGPRAARLFNYQTSQALNEIRFSPESDHKMTCARESRRVRSGRSRMRITTKTEEVCRLSFEIRKATKVVFPES